MASLTIAINDMTTRSQIALKLLALMVQRDGASVAHDAVNRSYVIAGEFLEAARDDWKAERAKKEGAGASVDAADAADEYEAADDATQATAA